MQFENTFFHLHIGEQEFNPTTDLQTEFTALEWMRPSEMIERWKRHEIRVAPPVVTLLMEVDRTLKHFDGDMIQTAQDLQERQPGRRSILFAHGVEVVPVKTATLPPADHTNAYLVGDPEGPDGSFLSTLHVECEKGWNNFNFIGCGRGSRDDRRMQN